MADSTEASSAHGSSRHRGVPRSRSAFARASAPLLGAALLVVSCGNSEGTSSGEASPPEDDQSAEAVAVTAPGVSDDEIRVAGIASITNPVGADYESAADGVEAHFAMVNDDGGVHGRTLVLQELRDDKAVNNTAEARALADSSEVFAVLPVATVLFTGADALVEAGIPTYGWTINPEWQGTEEDQRLNLFGQAGSYLCLGCPQPSLPHVSELTGRSTIGLLAFNIPQSATCLEGATRSIEQWGGPVDARVAFQDSSLAYGTTNLSVQVQKMREAGVDLVMTCLDNNTVVTLAKEMKKQDLDAVQLLLNAYDQSFLDEFGDLFEGSYVFVEFAPLETPEQLRPDGLDEYESWIEATGGSVTENSIVGWLNAAAFVEALERAGPDFDRQKVIDALNAITDQDADGMLAGTNWAEYGHYRRNPVHCGAYLEIVDSEMVPTEDDKIFTCFDVSGPELEPADAP